MSIETYHLPDTQDDFPTNSDVYVPVKRRSLPHTKSEQHALAPEPKQPFVLQEHPWRSFLVGMSICLVLFLFGQQVVVPFASATYDQWHYGDARLTQLDTDVEHGGTSHLIASYYHGHIVVIEILVSHPQDNRVYVLSGFSDLPTPPVLTLSVQDINGDGKPDLIIKIEGTALQAVLFNAGKTFQGQGG
ncbi:MAG TPA: hypothetical protein VFU49_02675 [Ktedonobacteraceae bacterium]|nr:hypothetical protein [Ktedonobacteraceae bacterium]